MLRAHNRSMEVLVRQYITDLSTQDNRVAPPLRTEKEAPSPGDGVERAIGQRAVIQAQEERSSRFQPENN
jgi:hypothetical protein